jgi:hypothetical protein
MQQSARNLEIDISQTVQQNEKLTTQLAKGKRLAAAVLANRLRQPLEKLASRWKLQGERSMVVELAATFQDKLATFKKLQAINENLTAENNALLIENEDLRQSSMDGLEIANVVPMSHLGLGRPEDDPRTRTTQLRPRQPLLND